MRLRIATCVKLPEPDVDESLLLDALARAGISARMAAWDAPGETWDDAVPTVIRSPWNYIHALDDFLAWAERAARAAPLWNGAATVRWNAHKSYLGELAHRGVSVVPTLFFARGATVDLAAELLARGLSDVVVKPTVSGGSFATRRFARGDAAAAQTFLDELLSTRDAMVQAYVASVEGYGERSLVWIDGAFTHAIRKSPRFLGQDEAVRGVLPIAPEELAFAEAVLAPYANELLYGRVDIARDDAGQPLLMELELIEPSLFFLQHPPALDCFVSAIARRLG